MSATGTHHYDCITSIVTAIQNLALSGIPNAQVYQKELLTDRNVTLPAVVVAVPPMPEIREPTDNKSIQVGYPCMVAVLAAMNQDLTLDQTKLLWRQQIEAHFDYQQPAELVAGLSDDLTLRVTEWQPLDVVDLSAFQDKNLFVSAAIVTVYVWKDR